MATKKRVTKDYKKAPLKEIANDPNDIGIPDGWEGWGGTWEYNYTTDTFYYNKLTMALTFINVIIFAIIVWNNL